MEKSAVHFVLFISGVVMIGSHSVFALRTVLYGTAALLIFLIACKVFLIYRAEMAKARAMAMALSNQRQTFVKPVQNQAIPMYKMPENQGFAPLTEAVPEIKKQVITALDVARHMDRVIMAGATRSGKTFCCKQIAWEKLQQGQTVIALDPKPIRSDDTWPQGVRLYGPDDNYAEIADALNRIDDEVSRRAKDFDNISRYPKILIFWDEIADMLYDVPEFVPRYLKILRKYAEYRIDLFIITQSDDYSSCGLPNAQLKRNFRAVLFFEHDEYVGRRKVFYNTKLKMPTTPETAQELVSFRPVSFPAGTVMSRSHSKNETRFQEPNSPKSLRQIPRDTVTVTAGVTGVTGDFYESMEEKKIVEMARSGASLNQIARSVWGASNGRMTGKIKNVLSERRMNF